MAIFKGHYVLHILASYPIMNIDSTVKVSVIICTYNRSELLRGSISAVLEQSYPSDKYEILVVDNNSSDDTPHVVASLASSSLVEIRYLFEKQQGLSYARNKGILCAKGEIIAFTDDDTLAQYNWIRAAVNAFDDMRVACVGGPVRPVWPMEKPHWLIARLEPYLAINEFDDARKQGFFNLPPVFPYGANIFFRKAIFSKLGLFRTNLGRKGLQLLTNDDVDMCAQIIAHGLRIAFAEHAVMLHKIAPDRMTKKWFIRRLYWQGRSDAVLGSNMSNMLGVRNSIYNLICRIFNSRSILSSAAHSIVFFGYLHQSVLIKMRSIHGRICNR